MEDGSVHYIEGSCLYIFFSSDVLLFLFHFYDLALSKLISMLRICFLTGAKQPNYLVTADDVDTYLAIEVQPLDNRKRKVLSLISCLGHSLHFG